MEHAEVIQEKKDDTHKHKRTEEVQHIIDRMPVTFFSRVTMLLVFTVTVILVLGWVIRYPDVVAGQLVVNSNYASLKLVANSNGRLKLNCQSLDTVEEGSYIACLQNAADLEDVKKIEKVLTQFDINGSVNALKQLLIALPLKASLGELNIRYYGFVSGVQELLAFKEDSLYYTQKQSLQAQLVEQQTMFVNTQNKLRLAQEHQKVVESFLARDSSLFAAKVISKADLERMQLDYLSEKSSYQQLSNEMISIRMEMQHLETQLRQLDLQRLEKEKQMTINLPGLYNELKAAIAIWEEKYVFKSPMAGKVEFLGFWTDNQFIQAGTPIFTIVPKEQNIIGQVNLPAFGSGKVQTGQEVIIKLDNYPFMEYGTIKGKVRSVSLITNTIKVQENNLDNYLVQVELPDKLKTTYGIDLGFKYELKGTAEIITHDRSLIERLFDNLRFLM